MNGLPKMLLLGDISGFADSSVAKESACNAGDPSSFPGSGRCPGEGTGYPLQYCWASLVAQLVNNPPAMWGTWVRSLGWEDPLEKGKATHSSILAWRIPWTTQSELDTTEQLSLSERERESSLIISKELAHTIVEVDKADKSILQNGQADWGA